MPNYDPTELSGDLYFARRLKEARRAADLPPSMQFDLAASDLDDDQLELALEPWGAPPDQTGVGLADVFHELMSRDPASVPVGDIAQIQKGLIDQKYAPPNAVIDGSWSPSWAGHLRRADRDATSESFSGQHLGSTPVKSAMEFFNNIMPSRVLSALVGEARGIVEQVPESAERLGLVGGAAGGAVTGASIGSLFGPGGTLVGGVGGAVVGGVTGFLSDFFGEDEHDAEDQSLVERAIDALSPYEEYKAEGRQAFIEDFQLIATAALSLRGATQAGLAVKGAASTLSGMSLKTALTRTPVQEVGWMARIGSWVLGNRGNQFKTLGAFANKSLADKFENKMKMWGLKALNNNPLLHSTRGVFSPMAKGAFAGRYAAGLGGDSKIEEAIAKEDEAMQEKRWATAVDLAASTFLYADGFMPFGKGLGEASDVKANAASIEEILRTSAGKRSKQPFHDAFQGEMGEAGILGRRAQDAAIDNALGDTPFERAKSAAWLRWDFGLEDEAIARLRPVANEIDDIDSAVMDMKDLIKAEVNAEGGLGHSALAKKLITRSYAKPGEFRAHLQALPGTGNGLKRMRSYIKSEDLTQDIMARANRGELKIEAPNPETTAELRSLENSYKRQITQWNKEATDLTQRSKDVDLPPTEKKKLMDEARRLRKDAKELRVQADKLRKSSYKDKGVIVAARLDDPERGLVGYRSKEDVLKAAEDFKYHREKFLTLRKEWRKQQNPSDVRTAALKDQQQEMLTLISRLENEGLVSPDMTNRVVDMVRGATDRSVRFNRSKFGNDVVRSLEETAGRRAQTVMLPQKEMDELAALGYRPVVRQGEVVNISDFKDLSSISGADLIGQYSATRYWIDSLGFSPVKNMDKAIRRVMRANQDEAVHSVMLKNGVPMSGKVAARRIRDYVNERNLPNIKKGSRQLDESLGSKGPWNIRRAPDGKIKLEMFKVDVRDLKQEDILRALDLDRFKVQDPDKVAKEIFHALRKGAAIGGETNLLHPLQSLRTLARATRTSGLPGLSDWMRTFHVTPTTGAAAGAAVTGSYVYQTTEGDEVKALAAALMGGGVGRKMGMSNKGWAYLPDKLHKANLAMRYTFSVAFDAGRYIEQNTLAQKYDLPMMVAPKKYIKNTYGEAEWDEALKYWDNVNGTKFGEAVDDLDRRMFQQGLLGFSPIYHEAAQAWILRKRWLQEGLSESAIATRVEEAVSEIGRYGLGRSAMEKSAHFIFFPFSFQKKMVTMLGDTFTQAPMRAFLIQEGMRRYYESSLDEKMSEFLNENIPIAQNLARLNNLAYGFGPGRFFLEGLDDRQSVMGTAAQALSSVFVPGGSATPLAQAAGELGDWSANLFTPIVIVGDDLKSAPEIIQKAIPLWNTIDQWAQGANEQKRVIVEGADYDSQLDHYYDELRELEDEWLPTALNAGYSDVSTFLSSPEGIALGSVYESEEQAIRDKYPSAAKAAAEFDLPQVEADLLIADLQKKTNRSPAEQAILKIATKLADLRNLAIMSGVPQSELLASTQSEIRNEARRYAQDERFIDLWDELYLEQFGPLRVQENVIG